MKRIYLLISFLLMLSFSMNAQQAFLQKVSINYVKTVAVWPLMKEMEPEWFDSEKDYMPKETLSYFNLSTDGTKSIFKKTKDAEIPRGMWYRPFADDNVVYNDYTSGTTISQKPVYEENFLVHDSLHNIKWKITADTRVIAGFECRKAVGILFDTVAVFAFYTDEIMVPGGPEGITGLPGMILGVGIPRLHTTWFATQVSLDPKLKTIEPVTKGKKVTRKEMLDTMHRVMKRWESYGQKLMLGFLI
ncbi:MAG: GLPGLI family protein [Chitinophagaceae bacterium]|nr:GLPGLI family protein [Chitinophagaceae bacterium]